MRRLALVLLVAACGGSSSSKVAKPTGPEVDTKTAESDAKGLLTEIYQSISRGKSDSLFTLLNPKLAVFGPRKGDALATREAALVALNAAIDPKATSHVQVRGGSPSFVASPGGHSAWGYDLIEVDGSSMAVLAVLSNDDDIWLVTAAAVAKTPAMRQVRAELKKVAVVPPGATGLANVDARAKGAVERFEKGLLDQEVWGEDLASRTEAIVIGPASGDVTRGKKEIKKMWKKRVAAHTREAASGEVTAEVTADNQLAWVTAPVTMVADDEDPLPLRVFAVFERSGDAWKMIALHEAVAFDEPGAGAPFVKILPPAPKPPEPPPKEEEAKKPDKHAKSAKSAKKTKKTKKKKKPADDE